MSVKTQYWLVKQEPEAYSWDDFVQDQGAAWTGVRNYQARNNLRSMKKGDPVLFYHSVSQKQVVGLARVRREHYADSTAPEGDWSVVDLVPVRPLKKPVALEHMKSDPVLRDMALIKQTRLSVTPLTKAQFDKVLQLGETRI